MSATSTRVMRLPAVIEKTGKGRSSIYQDARKGDFPKPIKITSRTSGWLESEIDGWIESRAAIRNPSPGAA